MCEANQLDSTVGFVAKSLNVIALACEGAIVYVTLVLPTMRSGSYCATGTLNCTTYSTFSI